MIEKTLLSDSSIILAAPTGSGELLRIQNLLHLLQTDYSSHLPGKTAIFEMCLIRLFQQGQLKEKVKAGKINYSWVELCRLDENRSLPGSVQVPGASKNAGRLFSEHILRSISLSTIEIQEWEGKFFRVAGLRCALLTGDTNTSLADCLATDIILSTPEKVNLKIQRNTFQHVVKYN